MASSILRPYGAGFSTGAGASLFGLYILSQAVPFTLEQWPRIGVGAVGVVLFAVGLMLSRRSSRSSCTPKTGTVIFMSVLAAMSATSPWPRS